MRSRAHSPVYAKGQSYVALSRATSLEGLQVIGFDAKKVMAHPKVTNWSVCPPFTILRTPADLTRSIAHSDYSRLSTEKRHRRNSRISLIAVSSSCISCTCRYIHHFRFLLSCIIYRNSIYNFNNFLHSSDCDHCRRVVSRRIATARSGDVRFIDWYSAIPCRDPVQSRSERPMN